MINEGNVQTQSDMYTQPRNESTRSLNPKLEILYKKISHSLNLNGNLNGTRSLSIMEYGYGISHEKLIINRLPQPEEIPNKIYE